MLLRVHELGSRAAERALTRLYRRGRLPVDRKAQMQARRIVDRVQKKGDEALLDAVAQFDDHRVDSVAALRLDPVAAGWAEIEVAEPLCSAIDEAIEAVDAYHRAQLHRGFVHQRGDLQLEERLIPYRRVGLYVPGGRFPYPSTVWMTAIPARIAGVEKIVVATPPNALVQSEVLRYTLGRLGVDEVWTIGGAQAIAALAYGSDAGTAALEPVDFIAGPGNAWVAAAKQYVSGDVGVDRDAGPSEVVIMATSETPVELIAADLLAQAEHDPRAVPVLIAVDRRFARRVAREVERQLADLATADTAQESLRSRGAALVARDWQQALEVCERIAPEHLQLMGADAEVLAGQVHRSGAIFVGAQTPTVFGDYVAGPSHVLPTGGAARAQSGLGVGDFQRRCHIVRAGTDSSRRLARAAAALAEAEGLVAHARSAGRRAESPST